jgi:hypothetical protein
VPEGAVTVPQELPAGGLFAARFGADARFAMIQDVDEALRSLVRREALPGTDVDVAFDAPTREWSSRRNAPTLDLYLYDIREDLQRREVIWQAIRDTEGYVRDRRPPPRHYKLSYLVTAWTQRPEDEHRLLSAVLSCFVRHERLPDDVLGGALVGDLPIFATIALPPPQDRPLSDVWSALGGELKPSLDLVIIAPLLDTRDQVEVPGPPVMEAPRFSFFGPRDGDQAGAAASAAGRGRRRRGAAATEGDAAGGGGDTGEAGPESRRPRTAAELAAEGREPEPLPDETVHSGAPGQPGRTVRLRVKR